MPKEETRYLTSILLGFITTIVILLGFIAFPGIIAFPTFGDFYNFNLYREMFYGHMKNCSNITNIVFHPNVSQYTSHTSVTFTGLYDNTTYYGRFPIEPLYRDDMTYGEIIDMLNIIQYSNFECFIDKDNILRRVGRKSKHTYMINTGYVYGIFSIISFTIWGCALSFFILIGIYECTFNGAVNYKKWREEFRIMKQNTTNKQKCGADGRPIGVRRKSISDSVV